MESRRGQELSRAVARSRRSPRTRANPRVRRYAASGRKQMQTATRTSKGSPCFSFERGRPSQSRRGRQNVPAQVMSCPKSSAIPRRYFVRRLASGRPRAGPRGTPVDSNAACCCSSGFQRSTVVVARVLAAPTRAMVPSQKLGRSEPIARVFARAGLTLRTCADACVRRASPTTTAEKSRERTGNRAGRFEASGRWKSCRKIWLHRYELADQLIEVRRRRETYAAAGVSARVRAGGGRSARRCALVERAVAMGAVAARRHTNWTRNKDVLGQKTAARSGESRESESEESKL